jgi:hypothetical protein
MRLKSKIWVEALLRRCQVDGHYGAVIRKGAEEAGAVFVIVNHLNGTSDLLGPPPGPAYDEHGERRLIKETKIPLSFNDIEDILRRRRKSDPDLWEVEIEDRNGLAGLNPETI